MTDSFVRNGDEGTCDRLRGWLCRASHRQLLCGAACFSASFIVYASIALTVYARFGTSMDLAVFYQGLSQIAGMNPSGVSIKGPGASLFGDHFHPVVLVAVPILWLWNSPAALLLVQSGCLALTNALIFQSCQKYGPRHAWALAAAAGSSAAFLGAASFDFHEVAVGSPLIAVLCHLLLGERWAHATWAGICCLLIKEDMGALILPCAILLWHFRQKICSVVLAATTLVWSCLAIEVFIPWFRGGHAYTYTAAFSWENAPGSLLKAFIFPGLLSLTFILLWSGLGFGKRSTWMLLPVLCNCVYRGCVPNFRYWIPAYHYWLLPYIFLVYAGMSSPSHRHEAAPISQVRRNIAIGITVLGLVCGPATWAIAGTSQTRVTDVERSLARVPDHVNVMVDPRFAARLATRDVVSIVPDPRAGQFAAAVVSKEVQWIVLDERTGSYGGSEWVATALSFLHGDFVEIMENGGIHVLQRRN